MFNKSLSESALQTTTMIVQVEAYQRGIINAWDNPIVRICQHPSRLTWHVLLLLLLAAVAAPSAAAADAVVNLGCMIGGAFCEKNADCCNGFEKTAPYTYTFYSNDCVQGICTRKYLS